MLNKHHPISIYRRANVRRQMGILRRRARRVALAAVALGFLASFAAWLIIGG